ncbi:MAG: SUMF1/EgtB/PvdO family nonheme iron enzyme [Magnetococcales bacterium]|nr:SUMF1/EgtB/PvdO family nonheme iron enzyme [Magnetococcales bacterium]
MKSLLALVATLLLGIAPVTPAWAYLINDWEPLGSERTSSGEVQNVKPGNHWRDPVSQANLLWIPGGCFDMGSPPRAADRETDEGPMAQRCVNDFWLGETEVTQGQWRRVMHNNPAKFRKGDGFPVETVSWEDVNEFLETLNARAASNVRFRLPTEAEWEFACRQRGGRTVYPGATQPGRIAWHAANSNGSTREVGTRVANRLGLRDMSGNVREWTQDRYLPAIEEAGDGREKRGEGEAFYAVRGGGWKDAPAVLRCANRGFESSTSRQDDLGLRLAASPRGAEKKPKMRPADLKTLPF